MRGAVCAVPLISFGVRTSPRPDLGRICRKKRMGASCVAAAGAVEARILACLDYVSTYVRTTTDKSASIRSCRPTIYNCQIAWGGATQVLCNHDHVDATLPHLEVSSTSAYRPGRIHEATITGSARIMGSLPAMA